MKYQQAKVVAKGHDMEELAGATVWVLCEPPHLCHGNRAFRTNLVATPYSDRTYYGCTAYPTCLLAHMAQQGLELLANFADEVPSETIAEWYERNTAVKN